MTISEAQEYIRGFAKQRGWEDIPNIDKFDHVHEELLEMSQYLRYKSLEERIAFVAENRALFEGEIGDVLFSVLRLANQLGVDAEAGFIKTRAKVEAKYTETGAETNKVHPSSGQGQFGSPDS